MLLSLTITAFLSSVLIFVLINNASTLGVVDVPNERSSHKATTPCGAGMAFIVAAFAGGISIDSSIYTPYLLSLFAVLMVFLLGIYDDYRETSPAHKFAIIAVSALLAHLDGLTIQSAGVFFGNDYALGWLALPVTVVAITGFTNGMNLIDGLDGLAGSVGLMILGGLFYLGYLNDDLFIMNSSLLFITALIIFLVYNWNPAQIFMGDSGSLTLGFIIALLCIKALTYLNPVSVLFLAAIPVIDTLTVIVRRKLNGASIFTADKNHLHHILLDIMGGRVKPTVIVIATVQLCFTLFGLFIAPAMAQEASLAVFIACLVGVFALSEHCCRKTGRC